MTDTQTPTLTFDGKDYPIDSLSEETQTLISALQVADAQIRFTDDNLKVLSVGRNAMAAQLSEALKGDDDVPN